MTTDGHREEMASTHHGEASGEISPDDTLTFDLRPPELGEISVYGLECPGCSVFHGNPSGIIHLPKRQYIGGREISTDERVRRAGEQCHAQVAAPARPGECLMAGTYADVAHLLRDLDLHVAAVALFPSPLVVLGATAVVPQGLQALVEGCDCGRWHRGCGRVGLGARGAGCSSH